MSAPRAAHDGLDGPGPADVRVLAIMGSGETAPTMARVHRQLASRLGASSVPREGRSGSRGAGAGIPPAALGALLDTPYGFQENADEITARALAYFERNVGMRMALAPFRRADEDPVLRATALARLREARYVFSGPGSPSYALAHWRDTEIPGLLADKLAGGGIVTFASAAALTLGAWTVPVYEIYKVGEAPRWLPGLDVLGPLGLPVAVIPHYDNAEGGDHDTRFCYLGEVRLSRLEEQLPETHFVLGVDSHTALVLDLAAGTGTVIGLGGVVVRVRGRSRVLEPGASVAIEDLVHMADELRGQAGLADPVPRASGRRAAAQHQRAGTVSPPTRQPLLDEVRGLEADFGEAAASHDRVGAVRAVLRVQELLVAWSRDTGGTDEPDRARAILQALILRLAEIGSQAPDSAGLPPPVIDLLVELRSSARAGHDFALADRIRDVLAASGVEVRDEPDGTRSVMTPRS